MWSVIDDLSTGRRENLEEGARRGRRARRARHPRCGGGLGRFDERRPELIFHLAAQIDVRRSVADPIYDLNVNVAGTLNLLEAARTAAVRVLLASTGGADLRRGRRASTSPWTRRPSAGRMRRTGRASSRPRATSPCTAASTAFRRTALRLGNVYGPRQDPLGEAGVVAIFCGAPARRRHTARVRRWPPDPRLHLRPRRRRGVPGRGRGRGCAGPTTSAPGSRPACSSSASKSPRYLTSSSSRRWPPRARVRCSESRSTAARRPRISGGEPAPPCRRASGRPPTSFAAA